jgi:hypothetical protein
VSAYYLCTSSKYTDTEMLRDRATKSAAPTQVHLEPVEVRQFVLRITLEFLVICEVAHTLYNVRLRCECSACARLEKRIRVVRLEVVQAAAMVNIYRYRTTTAFWCRE